MPELPEVETTVAGLRPVLQNARLVSVEVRRPDLRWPFPADLRQRLTGARVTGLSRRAKYGLIHTDRDDVMIFHLGMSGRWRIKPTEIEKHDHLVLQTENGVRVVLNDPRRFGSVDLVALNELATFRAFVDLGPEPLEPAFSSAYLLDRLTGRRTAIKQLLLDQTVVAGLGNIYVCEALHGARINPKLPGTSLGKPAAKRLVAEIKRVLSEAILAGGSTLRDFAQPDGELGYFSKQWRVYGREGEACSCGSPICRSVDGGRSTFYCDDCQRPV